MNAHQLKKRIYQASQRVFGSPRVVRTVSWLADKGVLKPSNKFVNVVLNQADISEGRAIARSLPVSAAMNVTNLCNYRCKFCEIHFFYPFAREKSGTVFANNLTVEDLKKHDGWLRNVFSVELSGATGEPFVNPHFLDIVRHLKKTYPHITLTATTNGSLISKQHIDALIDAKFNRLLFSVHGGNAETYKQLQGGDFNKIVSMIKYFVERKKERGAREPVLAINFALNKLNADSIFALIDTMRGVGIEHIYVQHYYDTRNIMKADRPIEEISYYYDVEKGNALLDKIYGYARDRGVKLYPKDPLYLNIPEDEAPDVVNGVCREPWRALKIKGCVEHDHTVYVTVCNRILLFKLDYKTFFEAGGTIDDIWNHPLVVFMRQRVGNNPICNFCLNPKNRALRCLDNAAYSIRRDAAMENFFKDYNAVTFDQKQIPGLEVLSVNPYAADTTDAREALTPAV